MPNHEFEIGSEIGVPVFGSVSARYRVSWQGRTRAYLDQISQQSGLTPEEIELHCEDNDDLTAILVRGGSRAGDVPDPGYKRTLAGLASSAFRDEALIDEVSLMHSQILHLEPGHLRVLDALGRTLGEPQFDDLDEPGARYRGTDVIDFREIYEVTGLLTKSAVVGALVTLSSVGMVDRRLAADNGDGSFTLGGSSEEAAWSLTSWGRRALECVKQSADHVTL